jgi:DNA-binding NarL/FixJ family response regulator
MDVVVEAWNGVEPATGRLPGVESPTPKHSEREGPMSDVRPTVVLADGHLLVAQALCRVLEDEFDLTQIVTDGQALLEAIERRRPDVVITDVRMPRLNGLEAIHAIRRRPNPPPIVVLTMYGSPAVAREALLAGASGFVLKQSADSELAQALRMALSGRCYVTPLLDVPTGSGRAAAGSRSVGAPQPTPRQCEVLELIARGCRMKEIAARLQISRRTVESHKYQLMATLSAHSTADLVQHAIRLGLIDLSGAAAGEGTRPEHTLEPELAGRRAPAHPAVPSSMMRVGRHHPLDHALASRLGKHGSDGRAIAG